MVLVQKEVKKVYLGSTQVRPVSIIPLNGMIAYYPMNSDYKDHKADLGVTGTTYNCTAATNFANTYISGKVGNCLKKTTGYTVHDGYDHLETGIMTGNVFSIMFWLEMLDNQERGMYGGNKTGDNANGFNFQFHYLQPGIKVAGSHFYADNNISLNTWYHIALTQNGSTAVLYVNGVGKTFSVDSNAGGRNLSIAGVYRGGPTQCLDEVVVYNRALSATEIQDYYNATK